MSNPSGGLLNLNSIGTEDLNKFGDDFSDLKPEQIKNSLKQDCQHRKKIIAFKDGLLDPAKTNFLKKHILSCSVCRVVGEDYQKINVLLAKNIPNVGMEVSAQEDIERELKELTKLIFDSEKKFNKKGLVLMKELKNSLQRKLNSKVWLKFFLISSITMVSLKFLFY